jgi:hypothetical protein
MSGELQPRPLVHFYLAPHLLPNGSYRITVNLSSGQGRKQIGEPLAGAIRVILKELSLPGSVRAWIDGVDTKATVHFDPAALGGVAGRLHFADRLFESCASFGLRPRSLWLLPFEFAEGSLLERSASSVHNLRPILERRRQPDWQTRFAEVLARDVAVGSVHRPELARALSAQMVPPAEALVRRAAAYVSNYSFPVSSPEWPDVEMTAAAHWLVDEGWLTRLDPAVGIVRTARSGPFCRAINMAGYAPVYSN